MADVLITEYTDPACPWAFSAEPFRLRLSWLYGDQLEWMPRMVVLADSADSYTSSGFTVERQAEALRRISREHGMPIDTRPRPRMAATLPACRAVVAARAHAPGQARALLRRLRMRNFAGELLDEPGTIDGAAADVGLDPSELRAWSERPEVIAELEDDRAGARQPLPAARVLDAKLANWSGGRRYTCPSYEILRRSDGVRIAIPGFQPFAVYDVVLANLVPGLERRDPPAGAEDVLAWAGAPLATQEVAVLRDISFADAREELGRVAVEHPLGHDGFWSLAA
ncbi:MAG: DsbA family protein [Solirubrobacterales bacterium]|nr:DsbA family protein [Solirubrobacterales bacterium]